MSNAQTIADLLGHIPGVYVARGGIYGQAEIAFYGGRGPAGLEVYWDGVPYLPMGRDSTYLDPARISIAPLERVDVVNSDTAVKPWDVGVHASRTTFIAGNAARLAAEKIRARLVEVAAEQLEASPGELALKDGWVFVRAEPGRRLAYERVVRAGHLRERGVSFVAEAFYDPPTEMLDKDLRGNVSATYGFAAQAVMLDVDVATGQVHVRRVISAHDVGRALNPLAAEGQIHGGIHMGLGYALSERLVVEDGQIFTSSFMDYAILRADDMPDITVRFIESVDAEGPFGAKGLGESGVIPVSAAVANALKDALGVAFTELPITPARIHAAVSRR